jgi:diguanylate cyclase (GGDEF)-like protein/PAS domain S-box-containing protein
MSVSNLSDAAAARQGDGYHDSLLLSVLNASRDAMAILEVARNGSEVTIAAQNDAMLRIGRVCPIAETVKDLILRHRILLRLSDGERSPSFDSPLPDESGTLMSLSWSFALLESAPDTQCLLLTIVDHTEHEATQAALREYRQRLALHVEQTPMAVIEWDLDFRVSSWNPAAEKIFGYQSHEALGRHPAGLIVPADALGEVTQVWHALIASQGGTRSTNANIRKDGSRIMCEWYNTPLVSPEGRVVGVASMVHDVTERLKTLEDQARANTDLKSVIEGARCLVWNADVHRTDAELIWDLRVTHSGQTTAWLPIDVPEGWTFEQALSAAYHPDDQPIMHARATGALLSGASTYSQEFRCRMQNGEYLWLREVVQITRLSPNLWKLVGVCMDIDDQKRMEDDVAELTSVVRCLAWKAILTKTGDGYWWDATVLKEAAVESWLPIVRTEGNSFFWDWYESRLDEDKLKGEPLLRKAISSGDPGYSQIFRCRTKTGEIRWMREDVRLQQIDDHRWYVAGICTDVTESHETEENLRAVLTSARCLIWHATVKRQDGRYLWDVSSGDDNAAERWLPIERHPGESYIDAWYRSRPLEDDERMNRTSRQALENGSPGYSQQYRCVTADGETRWLSEDVRIETTGENAWTLVGVCTDITEQKQAEERLAQERNQLRMLIDHLPVSIYFKDASGRFVISNTEHARLMGASSTPEIIGRRVTDFPELPQTNEFEDEDRQILENGAPIFNQVRQIRKPVGSSVWYSSTKLPLRDDQGKVIGLIGIMQDITQQKDMETERERMLAAAIDRADRDPLTGLFNHRIFHTYLKETSIECRVAKRSYGVIVMDLDNFKFFNDAYGHQAGDGVLLKVANIVRRICRTSDILARLGGDEFALILPGAGPEEVRQFIERLDQAMEGVGFRPPEYEWEVPLTLSVGWAVSPDDSDSRHGILALADERLKTAKYGDSDSAHIVAQLRAGLSASYENFAMLNALVSAVDNKDRYTRRHSEDVLKYSIQIANELGLDEQTLFEVKIAALLHDVGKIGVPDDILRKPGKLTDEEFAAIKQHPTMGAIMVNAVPGFEATLDAVRFHHERWDGRGYPEGLAGEKIPLLGRLMAVADAYSAMTTDRPYRKAMDTERADEILKSGAGTQWDPVCVEAFLRARRKSASPEE